MIVDLSIVPTTGAWCVFRCRNGELSYTIIGVNSDGNYDVRYEDGWYCEYRRDGTRVAAGVIIHKDGTTETVQNDHRDMINFELFDGGWDAAVAKYGDELQWGLHP